jgi:hypothetical protein
MGAAMILAFDQAPSAIGFAYAEPGGIPQRGTHHPPNYGENTARLGKHVREWSMQLMRSTGAQRVYFEQVLVRRQGLHMPTLIKQMKVVCAIETAAEMLGLEDDAFEVDIADWRREFYAGSRPNKGADADSSTWKELALKECLRRNWLVDDHNAAEACGLWFYGCLHSDPALRLKHRADVRRAELKRERAAA